MDEVAQFCVEEAVLELLDLSERRAAAAADVAAGAVGEAVSRVDDGAVEPPPFVPVKAR